MWLILEAIRVGEQASALVGVGGKEAEAGGEADWVRHEAA